MNSLFCRAALYCSHEALLSRGAEVMIGLGISRHASFDTHVSEICMSGVRGVVDAGIWRRRRLSWRRWCSSWRGSWQLQPPRARKLPRPCSSCKKTLRLPIQTGVQLSLPLKYFPDQTRLVLLGDPHSNNTCSCPLLFKNHAVHCS